MPVITLDRDRFSELLGRSVGVEEMVKWLPWLGVDIEEVGKDYVKVEFNPNRIDFSSPAGLARAFRGMMSWEVGLPKYELAQGGSVLKVDPSTREVRPYVVGAIVRNIKLTDTLLQEIIELQEDLHWGLGRNRRKVAIGIHDLDRVVSPFAYVTAAEDLKFCPLGGDGEMSIEEILREHEKGKIFGGILSKSRRYPLIVDGLNRVMSFPPIINSELTRVTVRTKNLFVDITGTDLGAVNMGLNVLTTSLYDMGCGIETVKVIYEDGTLITPNLEPRRKELRTSYARDLLGLELSDEDIAEALRRCRLGAEIVGGGRVEASIPPYRADVMHEVDLVEEVLVGYGCYKVRPEVPPTTTMGNPHYASSIAGVIRQIMVGLGFTEVVNFTLTNKSNHYDKMGISDGRALSLANPISSEYSIIRESLLPGLIENLVTNKRETLPQRLFEVSDVVKVDGRRETMSRRILSVAGVASHRSASFTEVRTYVEALLEELGVKGWKMRRGHEKSFLPGRVAILTLRGRGVGILGEVHPQVLNNFDLENPVCGFEIDVDFLLGF